MTAMFPLAVWQPGTLQPSTPVNDNALRVEVLQRGAISILSTPPGSPADGDVHIVGASPTGAWSTFAQHDVVMWRSGTWYRFAPFTGWLKQVGSDVRRFTGTAWDVVSGGGGGAVPIQDEGTTVVASPTAINFVGAGVTTTNSSGVATVTIPGGGGAPSIAFAWEASHIPLAVFTGGSTIFTSGVVALATAGTVTIGAISSASVFASRIRRVNTATAGTAAIASNNDAGGSGYLLVTSSGSAGGFDVFMEHGIGTGATVASHRFFAGLMPPGAPTDVNPSTRTNILGIGYDSADTQLQLMHNDGSGTATKVALGAGFPKPTAIDTHVYTLQLSHVGGSGSVAYTVTDLSNGNTASGVVNSDLPASAVHYGSYMSAGGTSTAIALTMNGYRARLK